MKAESAGRLLTPRQAGEMLAVSDETVRRLIDRREIPAVRVGPRSLRVRYADLVRFVESRTNDTQQSADEARQCGCR